MSLVAVSQEAINKALTHSPSQQGRILRLLEMASGRWVSLTRILHLNIAQYNTRIRELRAKGYTIENHTEWVDGTRKSWFRLVGRV